MTRALLQGGGRSLPRFTTLRNTWIAGLINEGLDYETIAYLAGFPNTESVAHAAYRLEQVGPRGPRQAPLDPFMANWVANLRSGVSNAVLQLPAPGWGYTDSVRLPTGNYLSCTPPRGLTPQLRPGDYPALRATYWCQEAIFPCSSTRTTDPLTRAMKYVQDGPAGSPKQWAEIYGRRNSVESINGSLKGPLGAFIDDPRTRLMRGWASQFFLTAFAVAGTNHRLIISSAKDDVFNRGSGPKRPEPPKRRRFVSEYEDDDSDFDFHKNRRTRGPDPLPGLA